MERKQVLDIAVRIGALMLKSGAEIYRVEQTIYYICKAYNMEKIDVYAIPSSIIATVENNGNFHTKTKRVLKREIDLDKLDKLNSLSRLICKEKPEYSEIDGSLKELMNEKKQNFMIPILSIGLVGLSFTLFFGGTFIEAIFAFFIAMFMKFCLYILDKRDSNFIFLNIIGSFIAAILVRILGRGHIIFNEDAMTIGILMALVPGMAVTNGMRDLIGGDFMAAIHRLIEALLIATAIAIGTYIAISILP